MITDKQTESRFSTPVLELEIRLSPAWLTFIKYCQNEISFGNVSVSIANGQPTKQIKADKEIRFDREITQPKSEDRVSLAWIRFVRFCQLETPSGSVSVRLVAGQPTTLIKSKRYVRFDKSETIPEIYDATNSLS